MAVHHKKAGAAKRKKRLIGERFARVCIYLFFTVTLAGFALFFWGAQSFHAQNAPAPPTPIPAESPAIVQAAAAQNVQGQGATTTEISIPPFSATLAPPPTAGRHRMEFILAQIEQLRQQGQPSLPPVPGAEIIDAEWQRIADMGIELPEATVVEMLGEFFATAYCCEVYPHICGGNGVTASGTVPTPGLTCATDWDVLPPGSWIYIEDVGIRRVEDSGSAILGSRLDIAIDTHANALRWSGYGTHNVWLLYMPEE